MSRVETQPLEVHKEPVREAYSRRHALALLAAIAIGLALGWLLREKTLAPKHIPTIAPLAVVPAAVIVGPSSLIIASDSPLWKNLERAVIRTEPISTPLLTVTGSIVARVSDGPGPVAERWNFSTADLSKTYRDWKRSQIEVDFAERQFAKTKQLTEADTKHREGIFKRLQSTTANASIPETQLRQAEAEALRTRLTGEKETFTAESEYFAAVNYRAALERELIQTGIEPRVFENAQEHVVLVVANVPEAQIPDVHEDQPCEAQFFGQPRRTFSARVDALGSSVSQERRTLRVLFDLEDAENLLKPGMFGEVKLGTNLRESLLVSTAGVLRIGRRDYVLVAVEDAWQVTKVRVGATVGGKIEILDGLTAGQEVLSHGALLLKPLVIQALDADEESAR